MTTQQTNFVNAATGICLVALGVLLLLQKAGMVELQQILQLWPVALILLGGAVVWQASRGGGAPAYVPIGGLVWLVILGLLFNYAYERRAAVKDLPVAGRLERFTMMGRDERTYDMERFDGARLTTIMGKIDLDLRKATLPPGESVVVDVFTLMGGVDVRVPPGWRVETDVTSIMAAVKDERRRGEGAQEGDQPPSSGATDANVGPPAAPGAEAPRIVLTGTVMMGNVTIKR